MLYSVRRTHQNADMFQMSQLDDILLVEISPVAQPCEHKGWAGGLEVDPPCWR